MVSIIIFGQEYGKVFALHHGCGNGGHFGGIIDGYNVLLGLHLWYIDGYNAWLH